MPGQQMENNGRDFFQSSNGVQSEVSNVIRALLHQPYSQQEKRFMPFGSQETLEPQPRGCRYALDSLCSMCSTL